MNRGFERLRDSIGLADNAFYGIIEENDSITMVRNRHGNFQNEYQDLLNRIAITCMMGS